MPIQTLRLRTFDLYQSNQPRVLPPQPVLFVDIGEESLAKLGQWPWPRTLGAELQSRVYGVTILLGSATARAVAGRFAMLELDSLKVKGKDAPEAIHTLLGGPEMVSDSTFRALSERQDEVLRTYRAQDWDAALSRIGACREYAARLDLPLIPYYDLMAARIRTF